MSVTSQKLWPFVLIRFLGGMAISISEGNTRQGKEKTALSFTLRCRFFARPNLASSASLWYVLLIRYQNYCLKSRLVPISFWNSSAHFRMLFTLHKSVISGGKMTPLGETYCTISRILKRQWGKLFKKKMND